LFGFLSLAMFSPRITLNSPPPLFPLALSPLGANFTAVALPQMSGLKKPCIATGVGANPKAVGRERKQFVP
jgi:hypothetical protein